MEKEKEKEKGYVIGTVSGQTYESNFLNLKYTCPDNMHIISHDAASNISRESMENVGYDDSQIEIRLQNESIDMLCISNNYSSSVSVAVIKKTSDEITPKQVLDVTIEELKLDITYSGFNNKYQSGKIAGKDVLKTYLNINVDNAKGKQLICVGEEDEYIFVISVVTYGDNTDKIINNLLNGFKAEQNKV